MITSIVLENFKCFRKVEVKPQLVTVFVGPNGSGKSSVLQALALLKQSLGKTGLRVRGSLLNLSGPSDVAPKFQSAPGPVHIQFAGVGSQEDSAPTLLAPRFGDRIQFRYGAKFAAGSQLEFHFGEIRFLFDDTLTTVELPENGKLTNQIGFGPFRAALQKTIEVAKIANLAGWTGSPAPGNYKTGSRRY